jgi:hypothetical protein
MLERDYLASVLQIDSWAWAAPYPNQATVPTTRQTARQVSGKDADHHTKDRRLVDKVAVLVFDSDIF